MIASRLELIKLRALLEQAVLGVSLLEEKLISLMELLRNLTRRLRSSWDNLLLQDRIAMKALSYARSKEGKGIDILAKKPIEPFELSFDTQNISGITIPILPTTSILRDKPHEKFPLSIHSSVDNTIYQYETLFSQIVNYVDQICVLQKLGTEIHRVRRQLANLEQNIIPQLKYEIASIIFILNEREMEDFVRLNRFKNKKLRKI